MQELGGSRESSRKLCTKGSMMAMKGRRSTSMWPRAKLSLPVSKDPSREMERVPFRHT